MNSKDFINALRKVIREEVQSAVRNEFKQINTINERVADPKPATTYSQSYKPKPVAKKQFTNNSMLNDLLNETAGFAGEGPMVDYNDFSEWPTMGNSGMAARQPQFTLPSTDLEGRPVTNVPEEVVHNLTKDYSALMKAIDKKKGN